MPFNAEQERIANHHHGPLLAISVAGSGKTTAIVGNLVNKYTIEKINPMSVITTAFNKDVAEEIRRRVMLSYPGLPKGAPIGTSHSIFLKMLREQGMSYKQVMPEWTAKDIVARAIGKRYSQGEENEVLGAISSLKNHCCYFKPVPFTDAYDRYEATVLNAICDTGVEFDDFHRAWTAYETQKRERQEIDMDDMLFLAWVLFSQKPEILEKYRQKYPYLIVDEYQDTNEVQYRLYRMLAGEGNGLICVGDDDQAIYGFRGAYPKFIRQFQTDYPGAEYVVMETNYRSQESILTLANSLIGYNTDRYPKKLVSTKPAAKYPRFVVCHDERSEADFIAKSIANGQHDFSNVAVLTRTNPMQAWIEEAFVREGIGYKVVSGQSFFNRKEIKLLTDYLRLSKTGSMRLIKELANKPYRFIANDTVAQWSSMQDIELDAATNANIMKYYDQLNWLFTAYKQESLPTILDFILNRPVWFGKWCMKNASLNSDVNPVSLIMQFMDMVSGMTPDEALRMVDEALLHLDADVSDRHKVRVSTIHSAKGLEWDAVYIPGVNEEIIPHRSNGDTEEERRLFYVACTRAKQELVLSGRAKANPSMFLDELAGTLEFTVYEKIYETTQGITVQVDAEPIREDGEPGQPRALAPVASGTGLEEPPL